MMSSINLSSECRWIYAFNLFKRYIFSNAMTKKSILLDHQLLKQFNLCILLNRRRRNSTSFIGAFCLALNHKPALLPLVKGFFPLVFHRTACLRIRGRTISPAPVVDRIITEHKIFQPVLARVPLTKVALNASWKSDRGWTMENVPPATEKNGQRMKHERYFAWIFTRLTDIKHATVS